MNKKGQALIELIIAIAVFAMVIVGFMQGMNMGILGTHRVRQSNAALDLARSQLEYVKQQGYILYNDDGYPVEGPTYKTVAEADIPLGFSADYIEIAVENIDELDPPHHGTALQQITVNVTYENGTRSVEVVGYKSPRLARVHGPEEWWVCTGVLDDIPNLPGKWGYYYVFETGYMERICATWVFRLTKEGEGKLVTLYIYRGIPVESWVKQQGLTEEIPDTNIPTCEKCLYCEVCLVEEEKAAYQPAEENYMVALESEPQPARTYTVFFYNPTGSDETVVTTSASITYYW